MKPFAHLAMNTNRLNSTVRHSSWSRRAFTVVELLVIVGVLALLVAVRLPALARVTQRSLRAQCAANLRQFALAVRTYASENNDQLPRNQAGAWAWDLPFSVGNQIAAYGAPRPVMYCPAFPEQNSDALWYFTSSYRVIGYAMTLPGTVSVMQTNQNSSIVPQTIKYVTITFPPPSPSQRVLLADATLSYLNNETDRSGNRYTGIAGGWSKPQRAAHLQAGSPPLPAGGNTAMLDGHVEWRPFEKMHVRTTAYPYFWW